MKMHRYIFCLFISLLTMMLIACASGPEEEPESDSFTSPARLLDQGIYNYNINNYPTAIKQFEKALLQYRSIDNQAGIARSCLNLAKTFMAINKNQIAAEYLAKADHIIEQASLNELDEHLALLKSSLAINNSSDDQALQELDKVLESKNTQIRLAALKNRTSIAFLQNDSDRSQWLEKYKALQNKHPDNQSHAARILRFEAEASDDADKTKALLAQSLAMSQELANRTAIAATLTQWAKFDLEKKRFTQAEDKCLRALFIRHQLGDVKNSMVILMQLQVIYTETDHEKAKLTDDWINKLESNDLTSWGLLYSEFDTYPANR